MSITMEMFKKRSLTLKKQFKQTWKFELQRKCVWTKCIFSADSFKVNSRLACGAARSGHRKRTNKESECGGWSDSVTAEAATGCEAAGNRHNLI